MFGCYELMIVHWFDKSTHMIDMIDTHMIHYFLFKIFVLSSWFVSFMDYMLYL